MLLNLFDSLMIYRNFKKKGRCIVLPFLCSSAAKIGKANFFLEEKKNEKKNILKKKSEKSLIFCYLLVAVFYRNGSGVQWPSSNKASPLPPFMSIKTIREEKSDQFSISGFQPKPDNFNNNPRSSAPVLPQQVPITTYFHFNRLYFISYPFN